MTIEPSDDYVREIFDPEQFICLAKTGSYYICNPPVIVRDWDYIVLVKDSVTVHNQVSDRLSTDSPVYYQDNRFISYRSGKYNLLVTDDMQFYLKFRGATELAKVLNLQDKKERILLFTQILDDFPKVEDIEEVSPIPIPTTSTTTSTGTSSNNTIIWTNSTKSFY